MTEGLEGPSIHEPAFVLPMHAYAVPGAFCALERRGLPGRLPGTPGIQSPLRDLAVGGTRVRLHPGAEGAEGLQQGRPGLRRQAPWPQATSAERDRVHQTSIGQVLLRTLPW